jgi:phosphatidylinositol kinase/protein kinase (PI-3  family)
MQMLAVLSPLDAPGLLKRSMIYVMTALRQNKSLLRRTLEIFVKDPTVDWEKQAADQTAKGAEVSKNLENLARARIEVCMLLKSLFVGLVCANTCAACCQVHLDMKPSLYRSAC